MTTQTTSKSNLKLIASFVLAVGLVYFLVHNFAENRFQDLESQTRLLISEQQAVLATIAETTARNGADSITEQIIKDCSLSERSTFDTLLGSLDNGLTQTELVELERLFGRCGGFYSERKSVMVSRLAREIEVYETYVEHLETLLDADVANEFQISLWNKLAEEEQKQSELFSQLVIKQDQIISTLLDGKSASSEEIEQILREVNEIQGTLVVTNKQVAKVRAELTSF
jgi:predicted DNA-binding transcriptional regulator